MSLRRSRHPVTALAALMVLMLGVDMALWELWTACASRQSLVGACRGPLRRACGGCDVSKGTICQKAVRGQVVDDNAQLERLRNENAKLRMKRRCAVDMLYRPGVRP